MKKIAVFVDGQNFYRMWRHQNACIPFDWAKMAQWLVDQVGGGTLMGVFYYSGEMPDSGTQVFLDRLETMTGFFVRRFLLKEGTAYCPLCDKVYDTHKEKEVDTSIVADMVAMAARETYDVAILVSGDADFAPALDAIRSFGRIGYVAGWPWGTADRMHQAAYGFVNISKAFADICVGNEDIPPTENLTDIREIFIAELRKAQAKLPSVGINYFLTKWGFENGTVTPEQRSRALDQLCQENLVEIYNSPEGSSALRVVD